MKDTYVQNPGISKKESGFYSKCKYKPFKCVKQHNDMTEFAL